MVDKGSSVPLYLQIQTELEERIRSGEFLPGAQIPSEAQISTRYNVSRMTTRKALDTMVSKGILYRRKGKGTYVAETRFAYGLSTMLSFSQSFRAWGYEVTTRVLQRDVMPGTPDILEPLQLSPGSDVLMIRRLRILDGNPAALHTAYLPYPQYAALLEIDLSTESLLESIKNVSGVGVAYTRDSVQADLASFEEARLLTIKPNAPVLKVEGIAFADNHHHTRVTHASYRGDMFKLVVTNTGEHTAALKIAGALGNSHE